MQPLRHRWIMLVLGFGFTMSFAISLQEIPPVLTSLISELGLSYTQVGSLMTAFSSMGIFFSILWGFVIARFGIRRIGIITLLCFISGNAIVSFGSDYLVLLIGRVISGIGGQAMSIIGASIVAEWFTGRELGFAIGVYTSAFPLGTIISLNLYGFLAAFLDWRVPLILTWVLGLIILGFFLLSYRSQSTRTHTSSLVFQDLRKVIVLILPLSVAWMFFQSASSSYSTFSAVYYQAIGIPVTIATLYASASMLGSVVLGPILGKVLESRTHYREIMVVIGMLVAGLYAVIPLLPASLFVIILLYTGLAPIFPIMVIYLLPKQVGPQSNLGYSILNTFASIGLAMGPILSGFILDLTGNFTTSFVTMMILMIAAGLSMIPFQLQKQS